MARPPATIVEAHAHCSRHRLDLERSDVCGCFYCRQSFSPTEIEEWIADEGETAMCPRCGIDSVIGSASGYPVDDPEWLAEMHRHWFGLAR